MSSPRVARRVMVVHSRSVDDTHRLGVALGTLSRPGDVWALHGDLGAGKTALVRGLARGMGLDERDVCSPTFVVVNEYARPAGRGPGAIIEPGAGPGDVPLVHIDAYRLGQSESDTLGLERVLDGLGVAAIEWPERLIPPPPDNERLARVTIEHAGESERRFTLHVPEGWTLRASWATMEDLSTARPASPYPITPHTSTCCATCKRPVPPGAAAPFCSERCRLADLHHWLSGRYAIPGSDRDPIHDDTRGDAAPPDRA